jgi:hypothetical protein
MCCPIRRFAAIVPAKGETDMAMINATTPTNDKGVADPLTRLLAEMRGLGAILPCADTDRLRARADYVARIEEDAVEAGFDNMPV